MSINWVDEAFAHSTNSPLLLGSCSHTELANHEWDWKTHKHTYTQAKASKTGCTIDVQDTQRGKKKKGEEKRKKKKRKEKKG